jgi:hypothetical protein
MPLVVQEFRQEEEGEEEGEEEAEETGLLSKARLELLSVFLQRGQQE